MTRNVVVDALQRKKRSRPWSAVALELGISPGTLSDILHGKKQPGPQILAKLGLEKTISYRRRPTGRTA